MDHGIREASGAEADIAASIAERLGVDPADQDSMKLLQHLRSFETEADLFLLADAGNVKDLAATKGKFDVHSVVQTPIKPKDLFGMMSRYLERRGERSQPAAR